MHTVYYQELEYATHDCVQAYVVYYVMRTTQDDFKFPSLGASPFTRGRKGLALRLFPSKLHVVMDLAVDHSHVPQIQLVNQV